MSSKSWDTMESSEMPFPCAPEPPTFPREVRESLLVLANVLHTVSKHLLSLASLTGQIGAPPTGTWRQLRSIEVTGLYYVARLDRKANRGPVSLTEVDDEMLQRLPDYAPELMAYGPVAPLPPVF